MRGLRQDAVLVGDEPTPRLFERTRARDGVTRVRFDGFEPVRHGQHEVVQVGRGAGHEGTEDLSVKRPSLQMRCGSGLRRYARISTQVLRSQVLTVMIPMCLSSPR